MVRLDRITQQPSVMGGKACVRGIRLTARMIIGRIAAGHSTEVILADYPYLEREDIMQAPRYAEWRAEEHSSARGRQFCFALGHAAVGHNKDGAGEIAGAAQ